MTQEEKNEFKQILHDHVAGIVAQNEAKNDIIIYKLDTLEISQMEIKKSLDFTNGKIGKAIIDIHNLETENQLIKQQQEYIVTKEKQDLVEHTLACPNKDRIKTLENENFTKKEMKKMMIQGISVIGILATILVSLQKLLF